MASNSPSNHFWCEFSLLFGDGGAEVAAFGDPVGFNCPEKTQKQAYKSGQYRLRFLI